MIVDAGRLGLTGSPEPLIYAADLMLLVMRSDLVALSAARSWAETLRAGFDELGAPGRVRALLVGEGRPYSGREVAKVSGAAGGGVAGVGRGGGRGLLPRRHPTAPVRPVRALPRSLRAAQAAIDPQSRPMRPSSPRHGRTGRS